MTTTTTNPYGIKASMTVDEVIAFLNSLLAIDPEAIKNLMWHRVRCNGSMADHPSVQVSAYPDKNKPAVGLLGILNGMFGIDEEGWGQIVVMSDDKTEDIIKFYKTSPQQRRDEE